MWGDFGVARRVRLSNSVTPWGAGAVPVNVAVQQTGILENLRILTNGALTVTLGTGTAALDVLGPWNAYNSFFLAPNQQAPILQTSGVGLYHINQIASSERNLVVPDAAALAPLHSDPTTNVFSAPTVTGTLRDYLYVPVAEYIASANTMIGMWPLQNPAVQLGFQFTPNSASTASPYNIFSTTAGAAPYLVTGNATVTLTTPTLDLVRNMWEVPSKPENLPPFNLVSTWVEEAPQGANVNGATKIQWQATALSGLLARLGCFVFDGNTNAGVAATSLTASNALQITTDADTPKFNENASEALARQWAHWGFPLYQGLYAWDLLGNEFNPRFTSLQDVLDTNSVANIKLTVNLNVALGGSGSFAKIYRQLITPLEVR